MGSQIPGAKINKSYWDNWAAIWKKMKLDSFLTSHIKINAKWIRDQNVKHETVQALDENMGESNFNVSVEGASNYDSKFRCKSKIHIKKPFCTGARAETSQMTNYEKTSAAYIRDKGLTLLNGISTNW